MHNLIDSKFLFIRDTISKGEILLCPNFVESSNGLELRGVLIQLFKQSLSELCSFRRS